MRAQRRRSLDLMEEIIAQVVVSQPGKALDKVFDYKVPEALAAQVQTGSSVMVPFGRGNREMEAYVLSVKNAAGSTGKLKEILRLSREETAFDWHMLQVIRWMREKYLCTYLDAVHAIVPAGINTKTKMWLILCGAPAVQKSGQRTRIVELLEHNGGGMEMQELASHFETDINEIVRQMCRAGILAREFREERLITDKKIRMAVLAVEPELALEQVGKLQKRAPVQARMLELLCESEYISTADLVRFTEGSHNAVVALEKKGLLACREQIVLRNPLLRKRVKAVQAPELTKEQRQVTEQLYQAIDQKQRQTFLLKGVTGSGKTEVFIRAIERCTAAGRQALVMVPEISLTPQMVSRFLARFGKRVAVLHSGLSLGEKYDEWKRIKAGDADIVIGARSAVFAPLHDIGIFIIDEEHSDTYKSEMTPRYDAREVAAYRAGMYGACVVHASATPSVASYERALRGEFKLLTMKYRYNKNQMPKVEIVDMREELAKGNKSMFSLQLIDEIKYNLEHGQQTILFLNRRGFSTFVSCRSCGFVAECPNCNISLTYHRYEDRLKCHYCGYSVENYRECPACHSPYIRYFGGGTQRVEEEVHRLFPDATTVRMDVDTTGKKLSHEKILETFEQEKIDVLIGTQMVAKGLDFENVTLVGVVSADTMLNIDDFRSAERTYAMLEQVSGRAGRGSRAGRAVIQTYNPEHPALLCAANHDYEAFFESEIGMRRVMWYPPECEMVSILFSGPSEALVARTARSYARQMQAEKPGQRVQMLGPIPSAISKMKNKYRWQILIKCENADALSGLLLCAQEECRKNKNYDRVSIVIDKNPNMVY